MAKTLLITGGSSEVGIRYIKEYGTEFDCVAAHYCHLNEELERLRDESEGRIKLIQADFSSMESTKSMISMLREQNITPNFILHLPSPKYHNSKFHKLDWDMYEIEIQIQLRSIILILQEFLPAMVKNKFGRIVFLLSSCTSGRAPKYISDYVTAKYALLGLMQALVSEYAGRGITVNAVSPGMMETKLLSDIPNLIIEKNALEHPYRRNVRLDDIIPPLKLFLTDNSDFVTGQNLVISG